MFENKFGLGSQHSIRDSIDVLATKGYIKFHKSGKNASRSKYGLLCVEGMELGNEVFDHTHNKYIMTYNKLLPTHYKAPEDGTIIPIENVDVWA